jgi:hypothetical protein
MTYIHPGLECLARIGVLPSVASAYHTVHSSAEIGSGRTCFSIFAGGGACTSSGDGSSNLFVLPTATAEVEEDRSIMDPTTVTSSSSGSITIDDVVAIGIVGCRRHRRRERSRAAAAGGHEHDKESKEDR